MVLLQLIIGAMNLWVTGYVPKFVLVARSHSVSPSRIIKKVLSRKARYGKRRLAHALRLDVPRLSPRIAALVLEFRTGHRRVPPADTPKELLPVATGELAELHIEGSFPRTTCFVQFLFGSVAIKWTHRHAITLHAIEDVQLVSVESTSGLRTSTCTFGSRLSTFSQSTPASGSAGVNIAFSDRGGVSRLLELRVHEGRATTWRDALRALIETIPHHGAPAHWRWSVACMAATSERGAAGTLRKSELRPLLRCANASSSLSNSRLEEALESVEESEQALPRWLTTSQTAGDEIKARLLNARQVGELLLRLSTSSAAISQLFERHNLGGQLGLAEWLSFTRSEQLGDMDDEFELSNARQSFERAAKLGGSQGKLSLIQFALQLLDPHNSAVPPLCGITATDDMQPASPLSHCWIATSHTYCIGDQLTGVSSADAYRRQLNLGIRHLEIDCWDGRKPAVPVLVTHGNTFCTTEDFGAVVNAITEFAFAVSELPVILSLEMHCSPKIQDKLAHMMVAHLGAMILKYAELEQMAGERAPSLSPLDLKGRILIKGKVKLGDNASFRTSREASFRSSHEASTRTSMSKKASRFSLRFRSARFSLRSFKGSVHSSLGRKLTDLNFSTLSGVDDPALFGVDAVANARSKLYQGAKGNKDETNSGSKTTETSEFYASCLCLRSVALPAFMSSAPSKWLLPITSINEDRMLSLLGLPRAERDQLEGLRAGTMTAAGDRQISDEQISLSAIIRLTSNPPEEVGRMQRKTARWLLRPYPLGLRFSGNNMSPIPAWLGGVDACVRTQDHHI